jgi:hypothetical protein
MALFQICLKEFMNNAQQTQNSVVRVQKLFKKPIQLLTDAKYHLDDILQEINEMSKGRLTDDERLKRAWVDFKQIKKIIILFNSIHARVGRNTNSTGIAIAKHVEMICRPDYTTFGFVNAVNNAATSIQCL